MANDAVFNQFKGSADYVTSEPLRNAVDMAALAFR